MTTSAPAPPGRPPPPDARHVADVTRANVEAMRHLDELQTRKRSFADRVADLVARACGHIVFVLTHFVALVAWVLWNTLAPEEVRIDPFPFTFLTMWASVEAIFLSSFVLISQNYQMRMSERRNQLDLQINLLAEQENSKMLLLLEEIARRVGALEGDDPEVGVLVQAAEPDMLARQIDEAYEEPAPAAATRAPR
ncbi:DUF1003 domain-containing protein [Ramlibacter algicola]|uniref:DUF1003 domain-containing protein n=1 Tax=Ramlibacter algicola TaxID=2795217 RepID=A0A934URS2_9BURK|nr:DUF1003 domain-containing protein [Ramlibacter algicola]MBK0394059.1 DUF1003 domain-containing protein [Ramlibacter algicola]